MTRKEITFQRPLDFSQWIRTKLPDSSTGYSASDLDFVLWNWKTNKVMLIEVKTRMAKPRTGQKMMWSLIDKWIRKGIESDWKYLGFHLVQFENTIFEDGKCLLDNKEISEQDLITFLSMNDI
jgi:hypothetical protein